MKQFRLLILLVCMAFSANARADIKVYDVHPSYVDEVYDVLRNVLQSGSGANSLVQLLPSGQILVNTTPELHQQVVAVLDAIGEAGPTPRVTLQYWVVFGAPELQNAVDTPGALDDVLDEIRGVHGPLSFSLLGNATLVTDSGMGGQTNGELNIRQMAYVQGSRLNAELNITFNYDVVVDNSELFDAQGNRRNFSQWTQQSISINTSMEQGEFVVVGENSISGNVAGQSDTDGTIFYIVHWGATD
jgi:hypothetical protein